MREFLIPFKGLQLGTHEYDWDLKKKFFEEIENPDILDCDLHVKLYLQRKERMLELNFLISGNLIVSCDRCLGSLELPLDLDENYYIKLGQERMEESEEVMIIPDTDYQIDVSQLIFDFVSLAIPMKKVHDEEGEATTSCDIEMIRRLESAGKKKMKDPRWDALKNIKLDNNN